VPRGHAADRLADEQLLVRSLQRRRVAGRDLLLAVAELGVVLLEHDPLRLERRRQLVDVVLRSRHRDRREAERRVDRNVLAVDAPRERELVLERGPERQAALSKARLHPLEERALADGRRLAVEAYVVGEERAGVGRVGQDAEGLQVGDEPDLADRAHPLDRLQLVEAVHRLHRDRQPDAARKPALEPVARGGLRSDGAVVAAPEEADEAEARLVRSPGNVARRHGDGVGAVAGSTSPDSRRFITTLTAYSATAAAIDTPQSAASQIRQWPTENSDVHGLRKVT